MTLEVTPKFKYLSAIEQRERTVLPKQLNLAPKRTFINCTKEANGLEQLYEYLGCNISFTHIFRSEGTALAEWDDKEKAMCILRKDGKFDSYGYVAHGKLYLHFYEALFLSESGRLQMMYNSMLLSLEKAYILFFDESSSFRYNEYVVYSYLTRSGCILSNYQNVRYMEANQISKQDCVWELLHNSLRESTVSTFIESSKHYLPMKIRFKQIKSIFTNSLQVHLPSDISDNTQHLDFQQKVQCNSKHIHFQQYKVRETCTQRSFLDILKHDVQFQNLQKVFKSFDEMHASTSPLLNDNCLKLNIIFDLYLHNNKYRKTVLNPPMFRIIIVDPSDKFPTQEDVAKCYKRQLYPLPILVVSIGQSKQMHAFLFHFK